ncbi:MAG: hypothetical protein QM749_04460 [Aquabacterium sp.]
MNQMIPQFQIGQSVYLNSDGPILKVAAYQDTPSGYEVYCQWIDAAGEPREKWFPEVLLEEMPLPDVTTIW